jgi:hypothetical protein
MGKYIFMENIFHQQRSNSHPEGMRHCFTPWAPDTDSSYLGRPTLTLHPLTFRRPRCNTVFDRAPDTDTDSAPFDISVIVSLIVYAT